MFSLKICGVTTRSDALELARLGVPALGVNFWEPSKRHCPPETARTFLPEIAGKILRVGVFVNNSRPLAAELFEEGLIDVVQLHGDESVEDLAFFLGEKIPVIRALPAGGDLVEKLGSSLPDALLLDTPAGKDYGGTGRTFDWGQALAAKQQFPDLPLILAGGLTPENAAEALRAVRPTGLDIASGAEISPGRKDFQKVGRLLEIVNS